MIYLIGLLLLVFGAMIVIYKQVIEPARVQMIATTDPTTIVYNPKVAMSAMKSHQLIEIIADKNNSNRKREKALEYLRRTNHSLSEEIKRKFLE